VKVAFQKNISQADQVGSSLQNSPTLEKEAPEAGSYAKAEVVEPSDKKALDPGWSSSPHRKKNFVGQKDEGLDWEEEQETQNRTFPWLIAGSAVMLLVFLGGAGVFYLRSQTTSSEDLVSPGIPSFLDIARSESRNLQAEVLPPEEDMMVQLVEDFEEFDLEVVQKVAKGFLNAETVTERAKYVRSSERVVPLMKKFYGGEDLEAEGFRDLNQSKISYRDSYLSSFVQMKDFTNSPITFERKGDLYFVDWESWVGYGDLKVEEMVVQKPTEDVTMRVIFQRENYYNFSFSDDKKWASFRLTFFKQERSLWAYVDRESEVGKKLLMNMKSGAKRPALVKVKYPKNARADDQVIMSELITIGWILSEK
jgi:hypothetical protein|tara:strand:+ start:3207 stop:4304 length:1098 start_codon:yes stop_codon:yes gene_type:complete